MKKAINSKSSVAKKTTVKAKDLGELKKPTKLKPLKEKDKKGWKNNLVDDDEEDFSLEDDIKLDDNFDDDDDEDGYFDDSF